MKDVFFRMADSWSSDDENRITDLRSAEKTRRCRGKKTVSPPYVVRYKVPGKITVPGRIMYIDTSKMLDGLSTVYNTHGVDKLLYYIQQRFERSRRDTEAVTHSRGEDREVCLMVVSYAIAYFLTKDKTCKIKINNLLKNIHNFNVNYADAVISQIQNFLFCYTMNDNNYSKAHKHLQVSLLVLQNVAPGTCTAGVYHNLAGMYEQLAYLMPHRKTSHLHSALHLYSVAREHYRCEGERTGDWELINISIPSNTLYMINIKLNMPNNHDQIPTSRYFRLYNNSLVEDSGRRCTVTDTELSAAEYMWDHITKPIVIHKVYINNLACVIYIYLRKSQIKKLGREYTLALEACVTAMSWYNDLYDYLNHAITAQIGLVLLELFKEIQKKVEATADGAGADVLHQEEEVVHSAECYIDERALCYTRTEKEDTAFVYSDQSDTSFDLSSDENIIPQGQLNNRKHQYPKSKSTSLIIEPIVTKESHANKCMIDADHKTESLSEVNTNDDLALEPDVDWSTVAQFIRNMGNDIDSSDENIVSTDSDHNANSNEGEGVSSSVEGPSATEHSMDFSNQMLLDIFSEEILRHNDQSIGMPEVTNSGYSPVSMIRSDSQSLLECNSESAITEDKNIEKNVHSADSHSFGSVKKHDDKFLKVVGDNGSELTAKANTNIIAKFSSNTCIEGLFQPTDVENKVLVVTREWKHDTESSGCESEYHSAQENIHTSDGDTTDSYASSLDRNANENIQPLQDAHTFIQQKHMRDNEIGYDIKPPVVHEFKYDPSVDDVTDSLGLDESSPNDDSQDTEVMDGY